MQMRESHLKSLRFRCMSGDFESGSLSDLTVYRNEFKRLRIRISLNVISLNTLLNPEKSQLV